MKASSSSAARSPSALASVVEGNAHERPILADWHVACHQRCLCSRGLVARHQAADALRTVHSGPVAGVERGEPTDYTVAIGNNAPPALDPTLSALRYADDDAIRYAETLGRLRGKVWLLANLDSGTQRRHPEWRARRRLRHDAPMSRALWRRAPASGRKTTRGRFGERRVTA